MDRKKMIQKYLDYLHEKDDVFEVSAKLRKPTASPLWGNVKANSMATGYFRDHEKAASLILKLDKEVKPESVYVSLNPCQKSLLAKADHKLKANLNRTKDADVAHIRNLLIDVDPVRKSGVSSTDEEHGAALSIARSVKWDLNGRGWPEPLLGDSGNGAHLIYKVKLNNTKDNVQMLQQSLKALAQKYDNDQVKIDTSVFNPGRLVKAYGTRARKGKKTDDRPQRVAKILFMPKKPAVVGKKKLKHVAANFNSQKESKAGTQGLNGEQQRKLDVPKYLDHYNVKVIGTKQNGSSTMYCLEKCLFNESHTPNEASIGQADKGLLYYQCFHNSCKKFHFEDARHKISGDDSLSDFQVGAAVKDVETEKRVRVEIVSAFGILARRVEEKPLIRGLLGQKESLLLYGPSGIGKSVLSINLALHLATPSANGKLLWGQFKIPEPVKTLFVQSENGIYSTHKRFSLIQKVKPNLTRALKKLYFPQSGEDCRLMGDLQDKMFQNQLQELIFTTGAKLLVLDPLISYHSNNENDNAEMRKTLDALTRLCEDTNAAVLVIHHAGKAGTSGGARGASAITDWAANIMSLELENEGSEDESLKVQCQKSRNFEIFPEFHLQLSSNLFFERVQGVDAKSDKNEAVVSALTALGGKVEKQVDLVKELEKGGCSSSKAGRMIKEAKKDGSVEFVTTGKGNAKGIVLARPIPETSDLDEDNEETSD
jgi:hypothetical protein